MVGARGCEERDLGLRGVGILAIRGLRFGLTLSLIINVLACSDNGTQADESRQSSGTSSPLGQAPASTSAVDTGDPSTLLPRLTEHRWKLIIEGDLESAYDYLSPSYRATQNRSDYAQEMRRRPVIWVSATYDSHECEGSDRCNVSLRVTVRLAMPRTEPVESLSLVTEKWVKSGGHWYFVPNPSR